GACGPARGGALRMEKGRTCDGGEAQLGVRLHDPRLARRREQAVHLVDLGEQVEDLMGEALPVDGTRACVGVLPGGGAEGGAYRRGKHRAAAGPEASARLDVATPGPARRQPDRDVDRDRDQLTALDARDGLAEP